MFITKKIITKITIYCIFPLLNIFTKTHTAKAHFYDDWCQLQTEHFTIFFRKNICHEAQRMANTLETLYEPIYQSFGSPPKNTILILNNQSFYSNGSAFPGRMVFCTLPTHDDNNTDWLLHLAIHELRHIAQFSAIWGNFLIPYHTIPTQPWFFEGDAVVMETALSTSGRGRLPSFSLLYRTNLLEGANYSYSKQTLGSMKDRVPDHYKIGYFMMSYLRKTYGKNLLKDVVKKEKRLKSFGLKIKQLANKSIEKLYEETNNDLLKLWRGQLEGLEIMSIETITQTKDIEYDDYCFPQTDDAGDCIAFKVGMSTTGTFVKIDKDGNETAIYEPRTNYPKQGRFSVANNTIAWIEPIPDPFWGSRGVSHSAIQLYGINTKKLTTKDSNARYLDVQLSPNGKYIATTESDESYRHSMLIFNTTDGELITRINTEDNQFLKHAKWSHDSKKIVVIATKDNECSIVLVDLDNNAAIHNVLPYTSEHLSYPTLCGNYIIYNSAYSGIDNIYALDLSTQKRYQITCRPYGAYNASVTQDKKWIYFNDFTKYGMHIARIPFNPTLWKPIEQIEDRSIIYCDDIIKQEVGPDILKSIPTKQYDMYEYPILKNALTNWGISLVGSIIEVSEKKLGAVLSSSDSLGVLVLKSGTYYNIDKNAAAVPLKVIFKGWYPILKLYGKYEYPMKKEDTASPSDNSYESRIDYSARIAKLSRNLFGVQITFPFTYPIFNQDTTLKIKLNTSMQYEPSTKNLWIPQKYKISIYREKKNNPRYINPTAADFAYELIHTPYRGNISGYSSTIIGKYLLPGLIRHHSFGIKASTHKSTNERIMTTLAKPIANTQLLKDPKYNKARSTVCLEYALPIAYIDIGYSDVAFFKRFYINLLLEYLYLHKLLTKFYKHPKTVGIELVINTSVINLPLSIGVRPTYTIAIDEIDNKKNDWGVDFVFKVNMDFL